MCRVDLLGRLGGSLETWVRFSDGGSQSIVRGQTIGVIAWRDYCSVYQLGFDSVDF